MKKKLTLFALIVLISACRNKITFQKGIVVKSETNDTHGYKYRVKISNVSHKGFTHSRYTLLTNENYRVGDTITIK